MKKILLAIALISLIPLAMSTSDVNVSLSSPSVAIVGKEFYVYVMVENLINFNAADYCIHYNASILQIEEIYNGSINGTEIPTIFSIDNENGTCKIIHHMGLQALNGSGYLSKIKCRAVDEGIAYLTIEGNLSDVEGNEIIASWGTATIKTTSTILKIEAPDTVSGEFYAFISIYNVSDFNSANFDILYESYFFSIKNIENGLINGSVINVSYNELDNELKIVGLASENISGSGYIAKITFIPKNEGLTYLNITNVIISNVSGMPIFVFTENKSISIGVNPPVANFSYLPENPTTQDIITFNASSSYDEDGYITLYEWDWDNDGIYDESVNTTIINHSWSDNGNYSVTLRVTDDDGAIAIITKTIEIFNVPPVANFSYIPTSPKVNETVQFTDSSYDLDGSLVNYTWNFGDGNISYEENLVHAYAKEGVYTVTLTVRDDDGAVATIEKEIVVIAENHPPFQPSSPSPSNGSSDIAIDVTLSWYCHDPDGDALTYDVYFGTSLPLTKKASNITTTSYGLSNLQYSTTYYWRIVAWDEHGVKTIAPIWHFTTKNKPNAPPTCSLQASPSSGYLPLTVTFSINANDEDGYIASWELDVDNDGVIEYSGVTTPATKQYTYSNIGTYTAKLTVTDNKGAVAYATAYITVLNPYQPPPPNNPPNVEITSPLNGSVVSGIITIQGKAWDEDGNSTIQKVEIRIDGNWTTASGLENWSYNLDTTKLSNGEHKIEARCYDGEDYSNIVSITVTVNNVVNHPPNIEIIEPANGSTVKGSIFIKGKAWDEDGNSTIQKVEIRIDGNWTTASGLENWSYNLDTTKLSNGEHKIEARCYDGMAYSNIASITVTVKNEKPIPILPIIIIVGVGITALIIFLLRKKFRKVI